jgi:ATP-dependent Lhr-like helicase
MSGVTRVVPVSLFLRSDLPWLEAEAVARGAGGRSSELPLSSSAEDLAKLLRARGAMFLHDLLRESRLLPAHLEDALGELVSRGWLTADGFAGLRQLIGAASRSADQRLASRRRPGLLRQRSVAGSSGRWSLWRDCSGACVRSHSVEPPDGWPPLRREEIVEQWGWQLLRRWGVVFKDLLTREPGAPSWWELLQVYRRLEARGEIRGGRFISGVAGEQFSMSESIRQLRLLRDADADHELVLISAADPLNLVGILDDQPRVPSVASHRLVYFQGRCVGTMVADEKWLSPTLSEELRGAVADALDRGRCGAISTSRPVSAKSAQDHGRSKPARASGPLRTR